MQGLSGGSNSTRDEEPDLIAIENLLAEACQSVTSCEQDLDDVPRGPGESEAKDSALEMSPKLRLDMGRNGPLLEASNSRLQAGGEHRVKA